MAKKTFKLGLGNIIKESQDRKRAEQEEFDHHPKETIDFLETKISRLEKELAYWRTGVLTLEKFNQSLELEKLCYNKEKNSIEQKT